jgi:N-hydroxyarylamine O-acetyltransferase
MNLQAYLERLNYSGPLDPTAETLAGLHQAHLLAVPFENLDIHLGRPIFLDETAFFRKIVEGRRGGFCYELNGLFAALLRELDFDVTLLSARVARESGGFGPEFDHLTLLVQLEERWLADVGFGECFRAPLRLDEPGEQRQKMGSYRLGVGQTSEVRFAKTSEVYETWIFWELAGGTGWQPQYQFTLQPRRLADFAGMCRYHQISPESHFTRQRVCSLATPEGRVTLSDRRLMITRNGQREEWELADQVEVESALRDYFGVVPTYCFR